MRVVFYHVGNIHASGRRRPAGLTRGRAVRVLRVCTSGIGPTRSIFVHQNRIGLFILSYLNLRIAFAKNKEPRPAVMEMKAIMVVRKFTAMKVTKRASRSA